MLSRTLPSNRWLLTALLLALAPAVDGRDVLGRKNWKRKSIAPVDPGVPALAIDAAGRPHVTFRKRNSGLHHAWLEGRRWRSEPIDRRDSAGLYSSIAIGLDGSVHVAYAVERREPEPGWRLAYARLDGASWTVTDVDAGGFSVSLALDAGDRPHVAHVREPGGLVYSRLDGSAWVSEIVAGDALSLGRTSLIITAAGVAHLSYSDHSLPRQLFWATNESGAFVAEYVADGRGGSLALDSRGRPHIAFAPEISLRYGRREDGGWVFEDLDPRGENPSLALDASDRPHIAYGHSVSVGERSVEVAIWTTRDGDSWRSEAIDLGNAGFDAALALDDDGTAHVLHLRARGSGGRLQYAVRAAPVLRGQVGFEAGVPGRVEIALTNHGRATARKCQVELFLSDDEVIDDGDGAAIGALRFGRIGPGKTRTRRLIVETPGGDAERFLIARTSCPDGSWVAVTPLP